MLRCIIWQDGQNRVAIMAIYDYDTLSNLER